MSRGMLQYPRALLTAPPSTSCVHPKNLGSQRINNDTGALQARRWVRKGSELCVEGVFRSRKLLTEYVAKYKFDDPQWREMLLLPCGNPIALELKARHCNNALKHLVQKGHAMYYTTHTQHSVLYPRGLAERAHITCAFGTKGERLVTNILHEGPLDAREPLGPRGIVAVSQVQGFGTHFDRKPMLWQRSRRVGALQAHMGAYDWTLWHPDDVGRRQVEDVMLLKPHTKFVGGGATSIGIVSSISVAAHPFHYVGEFDAPMTCSVDAVHQLAHLGAAKSKMVKPKEALHAVAWITRSPKPYLPLEVDLPFRLQLSRPQIFHARNEIVNTTVGRPFVDGVPMMQFEALMRQGEEQYIFDDSVASRPLTFWSQRNSRIFDGEFWFVRDEHVDNLNIAEGLRNPFEPEAEVKKRRAPLHTVVKPTSKAAARLARYKRVLEQKR